MRSFAPPRGFLSSPRPAPLENTPPRTSLIHTFIMYPKVIAAFVFLFVCELHMWRLLPDFLGPALRLLWHCVVDWNTGWQISCQTWLHKELLAELTNLKWKFQRFISNVKWWSRLKVVVHRSNQFTRFLAKVNPTEIRLHWHWRSNQPVRSFTFRNVISDGAIIVAAISEWIQPIPTQSNPIHPNLRKCTAVLSSTPFYPQGCIRKYAS